MKRPAVLLDLSEPVDASPEDLELMAMVNGGHPADTRLLVLEKNRLWLVPRHGMARLVVPLVVLLLALAVAAAVFVRAFVANLAAEDPVAYLVTGWLAVLVALLNFAIFKKEEPLCLN